MEQNTYSGFFNSNPENIRKYQDIDFARMLSVITNGQGYIPGYFNELKVEDASDETGLKVTVDSGSAWVGDPAGWWFINKQKSSPISVNSLGESTERIDKLVLRLNRTSGVQSFELKVIDELNTQDVFTTDDLETDHIYDMLLANIRVYNNEGATELEILDRRIPCINTQSTTIQKTASWTLSLTDTHKFIRVNSASDATLEIPADSEVPFPINTEIVIVQHGAGAVNINASSGVTVRSYNGLKSAGRYSGFTLRKIDTDEWYALGSLTNA